MVAGIPNALTAIREKVLIATSYVHAKSSPGHQSSDNSLATRATRHPNVGRFHGNAWQVASHAHVLPLGTQYLTPQVALPGVHSCFGNPVSPITHDLACP